MQPSSISPFSLFRLLRHNINLGVRHSPAFDQNSVAKVMMIIGSILFCVYLIGLGAVFGLVASEEGPGFLIPIMVFLVVVDFALRFIIQQTPNMLVKPYILLPISKYAVIDCFLISSLISSYNLLWLGMFIPYAIISLVGGCPLWPTLTVLVTGMLTIFLNSQFYLCVRTLVNRNQAWWIVPLVVYALPFLPCLFSDMDTWFDFYSEHGHSPWLTLLLVVLIPAMLWLNRKMQYAFVYEELSKTEKNTAPVWQLTFFDRWGQIGEYMKLEVKSVMRNKTQRTQFITSLAVNTIFSLLIAYTPIYDGQFQQNFWCFYCFAIYGVNSLSKVMGAEGNYIDLLMTHKENILTLLRSKYYLQCAMLAVPFIILLPGVFTGKFTLLMLVAYMLTSSGLLYCILFQLAVYNKQTVPLQQRITGKANLENGPQLIIGLAAFGLPVLLIGLFSLFLSQTAAHLAIAAIGLVFTLAHKWWLRNVYNRLMKRKYDNLEGFYATR